MSGRTKRILYAIFTLIWLLAAIAAAVLAWYFAPVRPWYLLLIFGITFLLLPLHVLIHELGHIIFGATAGMHFVAFKIGRLSIERQNERTHIRVVLSSNTAGECVLFPKSSHAVRGRFLAATLGGAAFNFIYGISFILLYFLVPIHPALLFFEMFAPLSLMEGLAALIPVELSAGKTDGLVASGIVMNRPEETVELRVLEAQGILYRGMFAEIPRELLFATPVVREDLPALHALLLLRMQYLLWEDREEEAKRVLSAMEEQFDELPDEVWGEIERYRAYFAGEFKREDSPLHGVEELETRLQERCKKKKFCD